MTIGIGEMITRYGAKTYPIVEDPDLPGVINGDYYADDLDPMQYCAYYLIGTPASLTGTVTCTKGSTAITGSGCAFSTELAAGTMVKLDADAVWARVASVEGNDAATLEYEYKDVGGTGAASKATGTMLQSTTITYTGSNATQVVARQYQGGVLAATFTRDLYYNSDDNFIGSHLVRS